MNNKKQLMTVVLVILLACVLGVSSLYTPQVKKSSDTGFSAERAAKDIEQIAKNPHTINDQEELRIVREYLITRLAELGIESEVFTYEDITDKYGWTYDINNIYGKIDGKDGEDGTYIMLVAHYDSSPAKRLGEEGGSRGAADDGYGLSTILEVLRVIQENNKSLENGIKILFTDAEETGLWGADKEMQENFKLYENVSFVINLEARGIKGPAIMFETSDNNLDVIKLFKKANLPVTYSLAADVYRKMPNGSDFTKFIDSGLKGINMAVLDNLDYYHTPLDNYDNINLSSLQHYGEQVLPVVEEFIYSEKYADPQVFDSKENGIYFTILPNVMLLYSNTMGWVLAAVAFLLLVGVIVTLSKKHQLKMTQIAAWTGNWVLIGIVMALIGFGVSRIVAVIFDMPFKLTYMPKVPAANLIVLVTALVGAGLIGFTIHKFVKVKVKIESIAIGGLILNFILLLIFMVVLPGGSFLCLWPLILACAVQLITNYSPLGHQVKRALQLVPAVMGIMMFVPILYVLNIALTIGALCVVMLLMAFAVAIIIPSIGLYLEYNMNIEDGIATSNPIEAAIEE